MTLATEFLTYQCPCCNAPLRYDGHADEVRCDSCGNHFEVQALAHMDRMLEELGQQRPLDWDLPEDAPLEAAEREQLRAYTCPACGAQIITDETTAATECVYCGNPGVLPNAFDGKFRPAAILPFVKTKQEAMDAYRSLICGKRLLPPLFAQQNRIEKITGVYVPFWLFSCDADADVLCRAERIFHHTTGDEEVTTTDHYLVRRSGSIGFDDVPVDGSVKFDDVLMEAIEPFDYSQARPFTTAYLPGYQAERYDVDAESARPRADERIRESVNAAFMESVAREYDHWQVQDSNVRLSDGSVRNVLLPVWMLNTRWNGQTYTFAMNGQTGKIVGDLPMDKGRAWRYRLGTFGISFVGLSLICAILMWLGVL